MDNHLLRMQLLGEIQEAAQVKDLNVELMEQLNYTIRWVIKYCTRNNIQLPNLNELQALILKNEQLVHRIYECPTLKFQHPFKTPDDSTEPLIEYFPI